MKINNINRRLLISTLAVISIAALVSSCGSGNLAGGGIGGTGRSKGVITGFGSFIVNGVEFYPIASTTYTFDGVSGSESGLKVGMVVEVEGVFDSNGITGSSTKVTMEDLIEGPVDSVATDGSSIVVLGQTVTIGPLTVFDNFTGSASPVPSDLISLVIVEVSGFPTGTIRATRIEKKSAAFDPGTTVIEIRGTVSNLNTSTKTFQIGTLIVNYSGVTVTGTLAGGKYVEVTSSQNVSGNTLTAEAVEVKTAELRGNAGEKVELQGFVNDANPSLGDFELEGTAVEYTTSTEFEGGIKSDVAQDVKLEVEGTFEDRSGTLVLVAESIYFEEEGTIEIEGEVTLKGTNSVTLFGISGIQVFVDTKTQYEDNNSADVRSFSLADISVNDHLVVRARKESGGTIIASRIEREDPPFPPVPVSIQGIVDTKTLGGGGNVELVILGVTIRSSSTPVYKVNDTVVNANVFFSAISEGTTVVKASGIFSSTFIDATELEI
jgi:hypothetical protein